jgi:hypothetical protein
MGQEHHSVTEELAAFITSQPVYFVATAPDQGRINISPKGLDGTFRVLDPRRVAFLNLTGSGNVYGSGRAIHPRDAEWASLEPLFPPLPGKRQFIVVDVDSVISSCGAGVPRMEVVGQRDDLVRWAERKGEEGIRAYWREANAESFDGLPTGLLED